MLKSKNININVDLEDHNNKFNELLSLSRNVNDDLENKNIKQSEDNLNK